MPASGSMKATQCSPRLFSQVPDEITLNILSNASARTLLQLRQVSHGIRSAIDAESSRLCSVLRKSEEDRIHALCQPLNLKDLPVEDALRLRVTRWCKPHWSEYWLESRSLAESYKAANPDTFRPFFQDNLFEFLLHLNDRLHDKSALEPWAKCDVTNRRWPGCCWLDQRACEFLGKDMTTDDVVKLLDGFSGNIMGSPMGAAELLKVAKSIRCSPLEAEQVSSADRWRICSEFGDLLRQCRLSLVFGDPTRLELPLLEGPMYWFPKIKQVTNGQETTSRAPAVAIAKFLIRQASQNNTLRVSEEHSRILRVALLEELGVCRLEYYDCIKMV